MHPREIPEEDLFKPSQFPAETCLLSARALSQASPTLRHDHQYVMDVVKLNGVALEHASPEVKDDPEVVMSALTQNPASARFASASLRADPNFMVEAVQMPHRIPCLQYASEELRSDAEFMMAAVQANLAAASFLSTSLKANNDFMLELVGKCGKDLLAYATPEMRADIRFVRSCVANNPLALQYASEELQDHSELVRFAIQANGLALQFASERLRRDQQVVLKAASNDWAALAFVNSNLRQKIRSGEIKCEHGRDSSHESYDKGGSMVDHDGTTVEPDLQTSKSSTVRQSSIITNDITRQSFMNAPDRPSTAPGHFVSIADASRLSAWPTASRPSTAPGSDATDNSLLIYPPEVRPWSAAAMQRRRPANLEKPAAAKKTSKGARTSMASSWPSSLPVNSFGAVMSKTQTFGWREVDPDTLEDDLYSRSITEGVHRPSPSSRVQLKLSPNAFADPQSIAAWTSEKSTSSGQGMVMAPNGKLVPRRGPKRSSTGPADVQAVSSSLAIRSEVAAPLQQSGSAPLLQLKNEQQRKNVQAMMQHQPQPLLKVKSRAMPNPQAFAQALLNVGAKSVPQPQKEPPSSQKAQAAARSRMTISTGNAATDDWQRKALAKLTESGGLDHHSHKGEWSDHFALGKSTGANRWSLIAGVSEGSECVLHSNHKPAKGHVNMVGAVDRYSRNFG